jgi:hypothetical protein
MIPIYGTPLGGKRENLPDFIRGRVVLVPWMRDEDLPVAKRVARQFVVDNSAFSAWRSGKPITDWSGYYDWVRSFARHPKFMWAAIPDVIDGSEAENDTLINQWPHDLQHLGVPVYHMHESLERARRLAETFPLIALGSSGEYDKDFGKGPWLDRMNEIMQAICDSEGRPICKLHGMRMLGVVKKCNLPLTSADSTNVARNAQREAKRHGVSVPMARRIIADKVEAKDYPERWKWRDKPRKQPSLPGFVGSRHSEPISST